MKIYSMTATFGKLENETLTLQPGLNIIEAPNEWGKSTWCRFILAMLYGLDTKARSTKQAMADKEKYLPWSGSPMSGRMEISWQGRDITIQRSTQGRVPMGKFQAFETDTGLPVPELRADNCGQMLLGVEQSVFRRTGFIHMNEMMITDDGALQRRLNDLVTTGDDSGDAQRLGEGLRNLKNQCRYHNSGRIPQLEQQQRALEETISACERAKNQYEILTARLVELNALQTDYSRHLDRLNYDKAVHDQQIVAQAIAQREELAQRVNSLENKCAGFPELGQLQSQLEQRRQLDREAAQAKENALNVPPQPEMPQAIPGLPAGGAYEIAKRDAKAYKEAQKKWWSLLIVLGICNLGLAGAIYYFLEEWMIAAVVAAIGLAGILAGSLKSRSSRRIRRMLEERYQSAFPELWLRHCRENDAMWAAYEAQMEQYRQMLARMDAQAAELEQLRCRNQDLLSLDRLLEMIALRNALKDARGDYAQSQSYTENLRRMAHTPVPYEGVDSLTETLAETQQKLREIQEQIRRTEAYCAQFRSEVDRLGSPKALQQELDKLKQSIAKAYRISDAAQLAMDAVNKASMELQRRFSPGITNQAQSILAQMTENRYEKMKLSTDFRIQSGAKEDVILRPAQTRSEGTIDQMYLALRLAVAQELSPDAPLVLDDALIRFDDVRLKHTLEVLGQVGKAKQILLFTCQSRENRLMQS